MYRPGGNISIMADNEQLNELEKAALIRYCFDEAKKKGISPITVWMEIQEQSKAMEMATTTHNHSAETTNKPSWQL